jgi:hypothetical protein
VIAPLKVRAQRLAERMGVSVRTARRAARDLDRRRAQFDRTMHRADPNDAHHFDLVLETASLGLDICTEVVVRAVEVGRPGALPAAVAPRGRAEPVGARPLAEAAIPGVGPRSVGAELFRPLQQSAQTAAPKPDAQRPRAEQAPPHDEPRPDQT